MGREVRRVPPDWQHPRDSQGGYRPMLDRTFAEAAREWMDACLAWDSGTHPDAAEHKAEHPFYWQWDGGPPDENYYRPEFGDTATWYQVYETVSEGTPVSPAFPTPETLVDYLCANGDEWEQARARRDGRPVRPPSREAAEGFVRCGWAPYMIYSPQKGLLPGIEAMGEAP